MTEFFRRFMGVLGCFDKVGCIFCQCLSGRDRPTYSKIAHYLHGMRIARPTPS